MSTQALRSTQGIASEVQCVRDRMQGLDDRVKGLEDKRNAFVDVLDGAHIVFVSYRHNANIVHRID